jgi:hypothetical protein
MDLHHLFVREQLAHQLGWQNDGSEPVAVVEFPKSYVRKTPFWRLLVAASTFSLVLVETLKIRNHYGAGARMNMGTSV